MLMYLSAKTNIPDVVVDYIEVTLASGDSVSLNWDMSDISRYDDGFEARYKGVYFDEEYANGRLSELEDLKITDIGLYYDSVGSFHFSIEEIEFEDNDKSLSYKNPELPLDCSSMKLLSGELSAVPEKYFEALANYNNVVGSNIENEYVRSHANELVYCFEHNKTLIDFDFWTRYEFLCNEKITYDEYMAIDSVFDGDPHDVSPENKDDIAEMTLTLQNYRATKKIGLDDRIKSAERRSAVTPSHQDEKGRGTEIQFS